MSSLPRDTGVRSLEAHRCGGPVTTAPWVNTASWVNTVQRRGELSLHALTRIPIRGSMVALAWSDALEVECVEWCALHWWWPAPFS